MIGVEWRQADETMDTIFSFEISVGVVAAHGNGDALDSRLLTRSCVQYLSFVVPSLRPAQIHPHQHAGPVLRFGSSSASVHGQDGVSRIVLTREGSFQL